MELILRFVQPPRLDQQLLTKIRMCNLNERPGSFLECLTFQFSYTKFSHYIVDVGPRDGDSRTWPQRRHNP